MILGCFDNQESLSLIMRETMIGDEMKPLLKVARDYIEITCGKSAVEVFRKLSLQYDEDYFERCQKLAAKFSVECMGAVILKKGDNCYYIIDGTHRLVVYAVRLLLREEKEFRHVRCFVYKEAAD